MKKLLTTLVFLLFGVQALAAPPQFTYSYSKATAIPGEVVRATVTVKNTNTDTFNIVITANASWTNPDGTTGTSTANSQPITIIRPITLNSFSTNLGSAFAFVVGSAKVDGNSTPATSTVGTSGDEILTIPVSNQIQSQQTLTIIFDVLAK